MDVTIHDLDTARWMIGEIVEVTAHGAALSDPGFADIGDIDTAVVVLRFENGALGVIDDSRADLARAAEESWRRGRTVRVEPQRTGADVSYTVKRENR